MISNQLQTLQLLLIFSLLFLCSESQTCAQSLYFNGQRCAPCNANCKCSSDNTCDTCLSGYAFDARFENCLQCPLASDPINVGCKECCSQIKGTAFVCSECISSNYVFEIGGQCIKSDGCLNLLKTGICTSCDQGYYLNQGLCKSCDSSCQSCKDDSYCTSCAQGYFNQTNINYSFCLSCPAGCQTCTSLSSCQSCLSGFYLSGTTCAACGPNCIQCGSTGCSVCATGSTLIAGTCYLCTDGTKSGTLGCLECQTVSNLISCTVASPTFYISSGQSISCVSTFPNSLLCTASGPIQCLNDYDLVLTNRNHLVSGQCISNTKSCKMMSNTAGDCSSCYFESSYGYYKLAGNQCVKCDQLGCQTYSTSCQCLECLPGYRYVNNLCVACQNLHCTQCQTDVQSCEQCATSYGLFSSACVLCSKSNCVNCDGDYTQCKVCADGYYLSSGSCYLCQSGCSLCQSNILCTQCANGYYLQANGRCKQKPTHCIDIDSRYLTDNVAVCIKCDYGYQVIEGNCYPCSQALYNLNSCEKYCPSYYALHKFGLGLKFNIFTILLVIVSLIFL